MLKFLARTLTALFLFGMLVVDCQASIAAFAMWHGVNLIVERGETYIAQFDILRELGANAVALVVKCEQRETALECPTSPTRKELRRMLRAARARGLRVMLKPHVETNEFSWRGEIRFETEVEWRAWFANYVYVMRQYARLNADAFCVGTELAGMSEREQDWRNVVRAVRAEFSGPLLYAAHFEEFERVTWWDAVDAAGVDAYFPLTMNDERRTTVANLVRAWQPYRARLEAVARATRKPILFTEVGYQSRVRAYESPWQKDPAIRDDRAQAFAYEAVFEAFAGAAWWRGALWWDWHPDDAEGATGFTPSLKPAEGVLMAHWRNAK